MSELFSILRSKGDDERPHGFEEVAVNSTGHAVKPGMGAYMRAALGMSHIWFVKLGEFCKLDIRDFDVEDDLGEKDYLKVALEVMFPRIDHSEAVARITHEGAAAVVIADASHKALRAWFRKECVDAPGIRLMERAMRRRRAIEEAIADQVGRAYGIELTVRLLLDSAIFDAAIRPHVLKDVVIPVPSFTIKLSDKLSHAVEIAVDVSLMRDGTVEELEPTDAASSWVIRVRDIIREEAPRAVTTSIYYGPSIDALQDVLARCLDQFFRRYGRRVRQIDVQRFNPLMPAAPSDSKLNRPGGRDRFSSGETVNFALSWNGGRGSYEVEFRISAEMGVLQENTRAYLQIGQPPLKDWLRERTKAALDAELVGADFVDFGDRYVNDLRERLGKRIMQDAENSGIWLRVFLAEPRVPDIVRTHTCEFVVKDQTYATQDATFQAQFEIAVRGGFGELHHIAHLLRPDHPTTPEDELHERLRDTTQRAAARIMRSAHADRYLMHFAPLTEPGGQEVDDAIDDGRPGSPVYLLERLRAAIMDDLHKRWQFECSNDDIQIIQRDEKFIELMKRIMRQRTITFVIGVEPRESDKRGARNLLPAEIRLQVRGIDRRHLLLVWQHDYDEPDKLEEDLKTQLASWSNELLGGLQYEDLRTKDPKVIQQRARGLDLYLNERTLPTFATQVSVLSVNIGASNAELVRQSKRDLDLDALEEDVKHTKMLIKANPQARQNLLGHSPSSGGQEDDGL